jgi:hypothetical protein
MNFDTTQPKPRTITHRARLPFVKGPSMSALEKRLARLEQILSTRSRGRQVGIWFDAETETEQQTIARAWESGPLQGNDEPQLIR